MRRYNPKVIEPKWQEVWKKTGIYKTENPKDKYYCLVMFPYPSGNLHIGHWYNFAPSDTIARYQRMLGKNVLHPMGFDAFGLPAENAAIKNNLNPADWTKKNISTMIKQLEQIGAMYDWDKTVNTSEPEYYKWTQWLFLKLYEKGYAYKKKSTVNWCPKDQTVLANEQVVGEDNLCERCDTPVVQKELEQWYFKITDYADQLLEDLEDLDWPERVRTMQQNWIGKSEGAEIDFKVGKETLKVFTTRPDTIYGVTFMVIAPEHELVDKLTTKEHKKSVDKYVEQASHKTELDRKQEKDKSAVFTGSYATNPANGKDIPIYISDFVVLSVGTGEIMGVPTNDERYWKFAKQNKVDVIEIIKEQDKKDREFGIEGEMINSDKYDGMHSSEVREKIVKDLKEASFKVNYKLRDWLVSRQRYWGPPIPIIYCDKCGTQPVAYKDLPVALPDSVEFEPTGQSPLIKDKDFVETTCPKCKGKAKRETDTLDTFVDSSWYFLRYPNTEYDGPYDPEAVNKWLPVDHYIGGVEHAILHLLYSRFIVKFLRDHGELNFKEPFLKLSNQGIILGPDGHKMSKSKGNVVDPDEQVKSYGADSLRLHLMFMGPYHEGGTYDLGAIAGARRFLDKVWDLVMSFAEAEVGDGDNTRVMSLVHKNTKKVTDDLNKMAFNTAIASFMETVNQLNKLRENGFKSDWKEAIEILLRTLAPFAPHITEELWEELGNTKSIHISPWPTWDKELVEEELVTFVVQVNGKVRANLELAKGTSQQEVEEAAQSDKNVAKYLTKKPKKVIFVENRLINFVV